MSFTYTSHHDTYPAIQNQKTAHKGHAVLITGASRGIGLATAISFAQAGASAIGIAARSNLNKAESEILSAAKSAGHPTPSILKLSVDVKNETNVTEAANQLEKHFGRLDILVNNAGYSESWHALIAETDPTVWWTTWEINIKGVYLLTRAFLPLLLKDGSCKTIVNISSAGALTQIPGGTAYQTSKFTLLRFTEFLVSEYATQGVVTYSVHPGGVWTDLAHNANLPQNMHGRLTDTSALAADSISWLTQEPRTWLNGRYVSVTWDMPELLERKKEIVEGDKLKMRLVL